MSETNRSLPFGDTLSAGSFFRTVLIRLLVVAGLAAGLAACAGETPAPPVAESAPPPAADAPASGYVGGTVALECAPFARVLSGVNLRGAAADWWREAAGRYNRSSAPTVGAVLDFRRTSRLPDGHAAVVSAVVSQRQILVTQANWVPHRVTANMPVVDISTDNDWSLVQVWWPPSGQMGIRHYPTWGFILPDEPRSSERLAAETWPAIRTALSD